ncbi:hypothetical protein [Burkholderia glumae]
MQAQIDAAEARRRRIEQERRAAEAARDGERSDGTPPASEPRDE